MNIPPITIVLNHMLTAVKAWADYELRQGGRNPKYTKAITDLRNAIDAIQKFH